MYVQRRAPSLRSILWLDAAGRTQPLLAKPGEYSYPVLSPNGKQLAFLQQAGGNRDIWIYELDRGLPRRITFTPESEYVLVWTPDSRWIITSVGTQLRMVRADGSTRPVTIFESKSLVFLHAISADGRFLAFCEQGASTANDLWTASLEGLPDQPKVVRPQPFEASPFTEIFAGFSPDGKWLAYASDESGLMEVYARPFPAGSGKYQVSNGGGMAPIWSPNGRELFYRNEDDQISVVDYKSSGGALTFSKPRIWSERKIFAGANLRNFSLAPDGKRFAVVVSNDSPDLHRNNEVVFLENFSTELRRSVAK
jgi:Tol biopolymer transport system component